MATKTKRSSTKSALEAAPDEESGLVGGRTQAELRHVAAEVTEGLHAVSRRLSQPPPQEGRLRTRLAIGVRDVEGLTAGNRRSAPWARSAVTLLADARDALESKEYVASGELIRAAERCLLEGRDEEHLEAELMRVEAQLVAVGAPPLGRRPSQRAGVEAMRRHVRRGRVVLDTYRGEYERQLSERARGFSYAATAMWGVLTLAGVAVAIRLPDGPSGSVLRSFGAFLTVVGLGVAGAVLSASLTRRKSDGEMLEAMNPIALVALRIGVGGLAALLTVALLQSGTQGVIDASGQKAYLFAVLAGLAERGLDRVIVGQTADAHRASAAMTLTPNADG